MFGATFHDGFARDTAREQTGNILFRRDEGLLRPHPITDGPAGPVDAVVTLLGQAFRAGPGLEPLMVLPPPASPRPRAPSGTAAPASSRSRRGRIH